MAFALHTHQLHTQSPSARRMQILPMALPTPPNSGKEALRHRFEKDDDYPSPIFAPIERPTSPSDAVLFPRRISTSSSPGHLMKRSWSDASHSELNFKRRRIDSPLGNTELVRLPPIVRSVSPPLPEHVELVKWFATRFAQAFQQEQEDLGNGLWTVTRKRQPVKATPRRRKDSIDPEEEVKSRTKTHARRRSGFTPSQQAKETKSTRNPANKALVSKNYKDWPDYSPPTATLSHARPIADAVPFMSGRKDLEADPLKDQLHPMELIAANHAGVDCGRYLCTKRSVFVGYLKHLLFKHGKRDLTAEEQKKGLRSWNKTAAQSCSSIDVNKTSCLFADFWVKLDWFNERHFKYWIDHPEEVDFPVFDKDGNLIPKLAT